MFSKLISKLKKTDSATHTPEELAALATIDTLEKTRALVATLEAAKATMTKFSPRHTLLCKQHEQAENALKRHQIEAERKRVAQVLQRDQASAEKALAEANSLHLKAGVSLDAAKAKAEAVSARLKPLEVELASKQTHADAMATAAQAEFDAAIANDDPTAETVAAEKLFQAQQASKSGTAVSGPLGLRVDALRREIAALGVAVYLAEKAVEDAAQMQLDASAELALIEYDRQAQALLDAHLAQRIAVAAANSSNRAAHSRFKTQGGASAVDLFEAQVSSCERIVSGARIDVYNQHHLPSYIVQDMFLAMKDMPNLAILAANAADLSGEVKESSEEVIEVAVEAAESVGESVS